MKDPIQEAIVENFVHLIACGWERQESVLAVAANFNKSENEISEICKERG